MRLTNTLSGAVETFRPLEDGRVGIYVCGVTPYEESHFGHAQYAIIFDAFVRYLRWEGSPGGGAEVTYVSNYTDIDDKVIDRAAELGRDPLDLVNEQIDLWERQQRALNVQQPDVRPAQAELRELAGVLGMRLDEADEDEGEFDAVAFSKLAARYEVACGGSDAESTIEALLARRQQAREERDFAVADAIRADLAAAGIEVEDTPRGARWSTAR